MQLISVEEAMRRQCVLVDTRSPMEYLQGHIPGAVNIPLLEDDERAIVGTLYKQQGPEEAKLKGLTLVSAKLASIVQQVAELKPSREKPLVVYCWRGGMRSKSVLTILELMGIEGSQLQGGYKAYRHYVQEQLACFQLRPEIIVLCGSTGTGKTLILHSLSRKGHPVIDLEGLANHRGSAFGQVGMGRPATAQNFDAQLLDMLNYYNDSEYILVECESKRVGNVYLPAVLYQAMQQGRKILIKASVPTRVNRLIEEYTDVLRPSDPEIISSLQLLTRKLGKKKVSRLIDEYSSGNLTMFVSILLHDYYDGLYGYETASPELFDFAVHAENLDQAVEEISAYLNHLTRG